MTNKLILKDARIFAEKAHKDQVRKYTNEPHINHPVNVTILVSSVESDSNMLAAALLHDVVEDTVFMLEDILKEFGADIASLVNELTDISKPNNGNRKSRKEIDRIRLSKVSDRAKTIKLADIIDNTESIIKHDPKFAVVYMAEKKALLEVLSRGHYLLFERANKIVNQYYADTALEPE